MQIQVNGAARVVRDGATVAALLRELSIDASRVAVEVSLEIIDRAQFEHHPLREGDRIEVLGFIGGGTAESVIW